MEKQYQPQKTEKNIYQLWEKGHYFQVQEKAKGKPFVITLPPPNVTGELHLGHALYTLEDIMIRYHRMMGQPTLWLPGFDHASIAVEYLVNKQLQKEGKKKKDVTREEFLKKAQAFAQESKQYIKSQLMSMGFSLDWTKEAYTLDEQRAKAVKTAFKKLYDKGLIYQGERITTWCPRCQTALSDLENDYQEEEGKLYHIKYGPVIIATTRPETMFADVALAVNSQDKRYTKLVGKKVSLPLTNRQIPIITDESIDIDFGTGILKVTPGHDNLDFEIGQKNKLKIISVIDQFGRLTKEAGQFAGLKVEEAREAVVKELEAKGNLIKIEKITHSIGHCQRCNHITEPLISKQWFIKMKDLAKPALEAIDKKEIEIIPKRFEKVYRNWLENIRDWCISRQLWWGHPIPIEGETDVLDTWFSSGLWPFTTLGWPDKTSDYQKFYPNTIRETGYDIIFFWVAREIMLGLFLTGQVPYQTVYLHGLIRDKKGQKMSKTKGNVLDPLKLTATYGTDALRMALVVGNAPGNDLSLGEEKVKACRNFANKIWNASRFILDLEDSQNKTKTAKAHPDDSWILKETNQLVKDVNKLFGKYRFDLAAERIYHFFWHTFCDLYLEKTKTRRDQAQNTLLEVLSINLRLLHPFMPFITEQIWQLASLSQKSKNKFFTSKALIIAPWPKVEK